VAKLRSRAQLSQLRPAGRACLVAVLWAVAASGQTQITSARSQPWQLPESILRETLAVAERGREFLARQQAEDGLWRLGDGAVTCWPAMAFAGDVGEAGAAVMTSAVNAVGDALDRDLTRVLTVDETAELARRALVLRAAGARGDLQMRAARRLAAVGTDAFDADDAALALEARGDGAARAEGFEWGAVVAKTAAARRPSVASVALAGLARLVRGAASDGSAVRAHVRWLARNHGRSAEDDWWVARFVDAVPLAVLHEEGFPLDWRQRMADALIARQRRDSATGAGFWTTAKTMSAESPDVLRETTFAVMVLARVSE
jgi:hypothetical protein